MNEFCPQPTLPSRVYEPPRIVHKGALKQFTGSPLGNDPVNPLDLLSGK